MSFAVTIKAEDVAKRRIAAGRKMRVKVVKMQRDFGKYGVAYYKQKTMDRGIFAFGKFYRGISYTQSKEYGASVTLVNKAAHAVYVEMGRRAGARMPPVSALIPWVMKKFGVPYKQARGIAFAVAKKIARRGIRARKIMTNENYRKHLASYYTKACRTVLKESIA